jgi:hypothetical protein
MRELILGLVSESAILARIATAANAKASHTCSSAQTCYRLTAGSGAGQTGSATESHNKLGLSIATAAHLGTPFPNSPDWTRA